MRIRHYFSINASASYDVRQGFELIEDYDQHRRCQTLERSSAPRKPSRSTLASSGKSSTTPRSSSVPALHHNTGGPPNGFSDKTKVNCELEWVLFQNIVNF